MEFSQHPPPFYCLVACMLQCIHKFKNCCIKGLIIMVPLIQQLHCHEIWHVWEDYIRILYRVKTIGDYINFYPIKFSFYTMQWYYTPHSIIIIHYYLYKNGWYVFYYNSLFIGLKTYHQSELSLINFNMRKSVATWHCITFL